jgi:transcriptional regulator with XRE-family HTH domain
MHGYRPPSTEPRGKWAIALHAKRKAEGLSQTEAFEILGPRLGLAPKSRSAYRAIDQGEREPRDDEAAILAEWLGYWPEDPAPVSTPAGATTVVGVDALLTRIDALVAQVEAERAERRRWEVGWIATLRAALEGQVPVELLDALVPPPPGDTQR